MKVIPVSKGRQAIVDDDMFAELSRFSWCMCGDYAGRRARPHMVYMHRWVAKAGPGETVDHINGNPLDNRRENLRLCTRKENARNSRRPTTNRSGYKGVSFCKSTGRWRASIRANGRCKNLGRYSRKEDAARAYNEAAARYFGEFACLNELEERKPGA